MKQFAKFVVDLGDQVAPTDIEEGMRVGVDRNKYQIHIPLPPKIDPTVTMMQVFGYYDERFYMHSYFALKLLTFLVVFRFLLLLSSILVRALHKPTELTKKTSSLSSSFWTFFSV